MTTIGKLSVAINADISGLERGAKDAENRMSKLAASSRDLINRMGQVSIAAGLAGAAITAAFVREGMIAIDAQAKLARQLGGTIDGLQGLQIAAGDAGVSQGELSQGMGMLNRKLGEAQRGVGAAKDAFDSLGLSASKVAAMDTDQRIAAIADRIKTLGLSASATSDILGQFGIRNQAMVDFLRQGGDSIRAARQAVDEFGLSISEVDAATIERANDAMERMNRTAQVLKNQLAIAAAPYVEYIADKFNEAAREAGGFRQEIEDGIETGVRGFAKVLDVLVWVKRDFQIVGRAGAVAALSAEYAFWGLADAIVNGPSKQLTSFARILGAVIDVAVPGTKLLKMALSNMIDGSGIEADMEIAKAAISAGLSDIAAIASAPTPTTNVEAMLESIKVKAREASEETVKALSLANQGGGGAGGAGVQSTVNQITDEEADRYRQSLLDKVTALQESLMTESEIEQIRFEEKIAALVEAQNLELITIAEFNAAKEGIEGQHMQTLADIRKKGLTDLQKFNEASFKAQSSTVFGELANITATVGKENRAMFEINKIAAIANAVINTHTGITKSLAAYPWPLAGVMAAAHAAAGFAQVASIKSQSFGSGGAAPSVASTSPGMPVTPTESIERTFYIEGVRQDQLYSGAALGGILSTIEEASEDGRTRILIR